MAIKQKNATGQKNLLEKKTTSQKKKKKKKKKKWANILQKGKGRKGSLINS